MTDLWLPDVRIAGATPRMVDNTGRFTSPLAGTLKTVSRPGDRWGFRVDFKDLNGFDRARIESFISNLRGAANRALFSPPDMGVSNVGLGGIRGSFNDAELFAGNKFQNGTASWSSGLGVGATLSALDRRLRITLNGGGQISVHQSVANMVANTPFVARYFMVDGLGGPLAAGAIQSYIEGTNVSFHVPTTEGLTVASMVVDTATGAQYIAWGAGGGGVPPAGAAALSGNYIECVWTSLSQCFLVDNAPNLLLWSDTLASPWTANAASVTTNATTAADGTTTASAINDTTTNTVHYFNQSATVGGAAGLDYMICGEVKAGAAGFAFLELQEGTGLTNAYIIINLSTGALGTPGVGTNWANVRGAVQALGNGWYYFAVIARKTNNATTVTANVGPAATIGTLAYAGAGTAAIYTRRITMSQSSVPADQTQSTNAATAAAVQNGSNLNVKGLYPVSTQGLLLPGDWFEVNKELKKCVAQLDSDGAGRGWLQFTPPIRNPPADNDPVIVNMPMGRFIMGKNETNWSVVAGPNGQPLSTLSIDLIEAPQ